MLKLISKYVGTNWNVFLKLCMLVFLTHWDETDMLLHSGQTISYQQTHCFFFLFVWPAYSWFGRMQAPLAFTPNWFITSIVLITPVWLAHRWSMTTCSSPTVLPYKNDWPTSTLRKLPQEFAKSHSHFSSAFVAVCYMGVTWARNSAPALTLKMSLWRKPWALAEEQRRTSLREKKGEEKALLSGYSNPTSRLFHLPYKAKARNFPLPLGPLKAAEQAPRIPVEQAGWEADRDGEGGTGVSPAEIRAEKAGALRRRSVTVSCES